MSQQTQTDRKLLKDWFDQEAADKLARQIAQVYPRFPFERFVSLATSNLHQLEFQSRVQQFANALSSCLPSHLPEALEILRHSLPPPLPDDKQINNGWLQWPIGHYIATFGLPCFEESMLTMIALTQCFTSEFAVRPFIEKYPLRTLEQLRQLTQHPNPHVRRWCSEGSRPRLPWGRRLSFLETNPPPALPILQALIHDPSAYVRRSVANHLNDLSRSLPETVLALCHHLVASPTPASRPLIRHALRTLTKNGHTQALEIQGFKKTHKISTRCTLNENSLRIGQVLTINCLIENQSHASQNLLLDFEIQFARPNGRPGRKIFKWTSLDLAPGQKHHLSKKLSLIQRSVRTLYPGIHLVTLLLNGQRADTASFNLNREVNPEVQRTPPIT